MIQFSWKGTRRNARAMAGVSLFGLLSVATLASVDSAYARPPRSDVIYGDDNRADYYDVVGSGWDTIADSTVALVQKERVITNGSVSQLNSVIYGEDLGLCTDEPFWHQPTAAFCSGSLVGPDLILTAGHCVSEDELPCRDISVVFGFHMNNEQADPTRIPTSEVYQCAEVVARTFTARGPDWAVLRLNRVVEGHRPLQVNRGAPVTPGTKLVVVGHPSGLPTKIAGGASVRAVEGNSHFKANLDTYGGNSGSAVFNAETGLVEGILVRGEQDFERRRGSDDWWGGGSSCIQSHRCTDDGCNGEDVTLVSNVLQYIPSTVIAREPSRGTNGNGRPSARGSRQPMDGGVPLPAGPGR